MSIYHIPKSESHPKTMVMIAGYQIDNPTSFESMEISGESRLTLHLTFASNDYSPNKFTRFLDAFNDFLIEYNKL